MRTTIAELSSDRCLIGPCVTTPLQAIATVRAACTRRSCAAGCTCGTPTASWSCRTNGSPRLRLLRALSDREEAARPSVIAGRWARPWLADALRVVDAGAD